MPSTNPGRTCTDLEFTGPSKRCAARPPHRTDRLATRTCGHPHLRPGLCLFLPPCIWEPPLTTEDLTEGTEPLLGLSLSLVQPRTNFVTSLLSVGVGAAADRTRIHFPKSREQRRPSVTEHVGVAQAFPSAWTLPLGGSGPVRRPHLELHLMEFPPRPFISSTAD